jgi:hypothetical protein
MRWFLSLFNHKTDHLNARVNLFVVTKTERNARRFVTGE